MKYKFLHIVLFACMVLSIFSMRLNAQISDDFSDGTLSQNPVWLGDTASFKINAFMQLQLDESGSGTRFISTQSGYSDNAVWEFWLKMDFSPSSNNYIKIYLTSDKADLKASLNGYFVRIGENGSNDGLDLFRQNGSTSTKIIDGQVSNLSVKPELKVKVVHESNGKWHLYSDVNSSGKFVEEGAVVDNINHSASFFGICCNYTSSNSKAFYFDNLKIDVNEKDSLPPGLLSVKLLSDIVIQLDFNESLKETVAENTGNYFLWPINKSPVSASLVSGSHVELTFDVAFENGKNYRIDCKNISDKSGNILLAGSLDFEFFIPAKGNIVINELMPDPTPSVGLPDAEYLELLNVSGKDISLAGWQLSDVTTSVTLPDTVIKNGEYIIVCETTRMADFAPYGKVIGLALPSLNNSGDQIKIRSGQGLIIDELNYNPGWFKDAGKSSGGWALERIDPFYPCSNPANWQASVNPDGGTPGKVNSVYHVAVDTVAPVVSYYSFIDYQSLRLVFNENIDNPDLSAYWFKMLCQKKVSEVKAIGNNEVQLTIKPGFQNLDTCTLQFNRIADCWGNRDTSWRSLSVQYIEPSEPAGFEVIISEIMADPEPSVQLPASEYIEIYNRSNKYFQLKNWKFGNHSKTATLPELLMAPGTYLIICDKSKSNQFLNYGNVVGVNGFPSLNNSGDDLMLKDDKGNPVFHIRYSDSWYHNDLKKQGGWSLEIIDPDNFCESEANWAASENASGGTPGVQNSVYQFNPDLTDPVVRALTCPDSMHLWISFSEKMDSLSLKDISHYQLSGNSPAIVNISANSPYFNEITISFKTPLQQGEMYSLQIKAVTDCAGNKPEEDAFNFGLPGTADSFDVVINEVLFNPWPGGYDFVELYNRSDKIIDLADLVLANYDENGNVARAKEITGFGYLLFPDDFAVLTIDRQGLENLYLVKYPQKVIEMTVLPSFNDDKGNVLLLSRANKAIDYFSYKKEYHSMLIKNREGVSLERLNPEQPTNDPANWFSSASDAGYATPTYKNSQFSDISFEDNTITLSSNIFTPDFDGHDDQLIISYKLNKTGYHGSIKIYNTEGRLIKTISDHFLTGREGFMAWDGSTDAGSRAAMGVYILLIKLHHPDGETRIIKKTTTLFLRNN